MTGKKIENILKDSFHRSEPSFTWKKKAKDNIMHYTRTHIPITPSYNKNVKTMVIGIAGFMLFLLIMVPTADVLADEAKPGDVLYPVGRFFEQAKLAFASKEQKKELIQEHLDKRMAELEYVSQSNESIYESEIAQDLEIQTSFIIENDSFTLEEKRVIAKNLKERLVKLEESKKRDNIADQLENVRTILSKTEVKIEHKENISDENIDSEEEVLGIGGVEPINDEKKEDSNKNDNNSSSSNEDRSVKTSPTQKAEDVKKIDDARSIFKIE